MLERIVSEECRPDTDTFLLAAAVHDVVIGVCGFRGQRRREFNEHDVNLKVELKRIGVLLIPVYAKSGQRARKK